MSKSKVFAAVIFSATLSGAAFAEESKDSVIEVAFTYDHAVSASENLEAMEVAANSACSAAYAGDKLYFSSRSRNVSDCQEELVAKGVDMFDSPMLKAAYTGADATMTVSMLD